MEKYLEYKDNKSQKFWKIEVNENAFTITYGKIGTTGQSKTKDFDDAAIALKEANKLVAQKIKKGYIENEKSKDEIVWTTELQEYAAAIAEISSKSTEDIVAIVKQQINDGTLSLTSNKKEEIHKNKHVANPDYFAELVKFDEKYGGETYAQSFWITEDEDDFFESWLHEVSEKQEKEYSQSMKIFASADGTGGRYAFWFTKGNTDPNKAPIISYGSEGDISIVAESIKDLIKILSFGAEGMEASFGHYFDDDDYDDEYDFYKSFLEYNPNFEIFRKWMKEVLNIEPVSIESLKAGECEESDEVNNLVAAANKKLKEQFDNWQYQFYPNLEAEEAAESAKIKENYLKKKEKLLRKVAENPSSKLYLKLAKNQFSLDSDDIDEDIQNERIGYLEKALEFDSTNKKTLEDLASSYGVEDAEKSIPLYTKLIALCKKPAKYYFDLARAYENKDDLEKALEYYVKFLIEKPNKYSQLTQDEIISTCKELKKNPIQVLENTLEYGENIETIKVLYKLYLNKKKYKEASDYALQYIDKTDLQAHNYVTISDRFLKKEAYKEALPILEKTLSRHKWEDRKLRTYNNIGLCYLRMQPQNMDKALDAFQNAYKINNKESAIHQNLYICGTYFYKIKEFKKALGILEFCVSNFDYEKEDSLAMIKEMKKGKR